MISSSCLDELDNQSPVERFSVLPSNGPFSSLRSKQLQSSVLMDNQARFRVLQDLKLSSCEVPIPAANEPASPMSADSSPVCLDES